MTRYRLVGDDWVPAAEAPAPKYRGETSGVIVKDYEHVSRQLPRWHKDAPRHTKEGRCVFRNKREVEEFQAKTQYGWDKQ